jgi:hypothetical protein
MAQHTLDLTAWRAAFPAFADTTKYPDATVQMWWTMATAYINDYDNCLICGNVLQTALNLMTAHLAQSFTMIGNGQVTAPVTGAAEGTVNVTLQAPPSKNGWQFWLSTTPYGLQLWALLSSLVVGGFTIGGAPESQGFRRVYGVFK